MHTHSDKTKKKVLFKCNSNIKSVLAMSSQLEGKYSPSDLSQYIFDILSNKIYNYTYIKIVNDKCTIKERFEKSIIFVFEE
jgi:hypothetical protein